MKLVKVHASWLDIYVKKKKKKEEEETLNASLSSKKWFFEIEETHQNWSEIEVVASAVNNQKSTALSLYQSTRYSLILIFDWPF